MNAEAPSEAICQTTNIATSSSSRNQKMRKRLLAAILDCAVDAFPAVGLRADIDVIAG
ncbi:hypothetical protein [Rhodopseudomonas sp. B29]|uniref:hypothetical protein n=1 Tax=Rhodopseudomonas sp. B29 TaxID=95607 RepID=UPI001FCC3040|nr:hypothetical protein [Rhodopseudomonas sp. B29]